jgi:type IV pilus assembly protein PilA
MLKLRQRIGNESGFTLVELLVVMLILGILAAIAIPTFFNQRDKAQDSDAKVTARTAETAMETYATDNGGDYSGATPALLHDIEATLPDTAPALDVDVPASGPGGGEYTVTAQSDTLNTFSITRHSDGTKTLHCETDGDAGCPPAEAGVTYGDWSGD